MSVGVCVNEEQFPKVRVRQIWSECQYLKANTCVRDRAKSEVAPGYLAWYRRELEHERPAKRPHLQEFIKASQEQWDWLAKEESYRAEIGQLKQQIKNLGFENSLQVDANQGEKNKLAQENKALKAQNRQMRIDADNQQSSRSDERLINGLKKEIIERREDLKKSERAVAQLRAQWAKKTKERKQYLQQVKKEYEKTIAKLKGKMTTLEDKAAKQVEAYEIESGHCYDLLARMEDEIWQLQRQHLQDSQVLGGRSDQIRRLLIEKGRTRNKIGTIAHAIIRRCRMCEDMTRTTFLSAVMIFVKRTIYELEQLERDLAPKPATRPNDASRAPTFGTLM
ncbi:uncharacterized protein [Nicotiana sylvestris]|uniref:uncharacterized protein n=1 Tax=Nicotiana sylvestris TaxID=4096 RepID=UPI00388CD247